MKQAKKPFVIGICGGSGSGKTTILKRLAEDFEDSKPALFTMDNYYIPMESQIKDHNGVINFDLPSALDEQMLTHDLSRLTSGQGIEVKEYFFNTAPGKNVLLSIEPSQLVLVEGLFLFHYEGVRRLVDYSIFVDVNPNIQLDRRIYRDQETRGYKRSDIIYQWEHHVIPCYENYIIPYKEEAHFHFRNDQNAEADYAQLVSELKALMQA